MSIASVVVRAAAVTAVGLVVSAAQAATQSYPTNACVGRKQAAAAQYCRDALHAWAGWDRDADAGRRDAKLASGRAALSGTWSAAESQSSAAGVDCAETTADAGAVADAVDSAVGAILASVNVGLSPGTKSGRCGGALLDVAARKCGRLLDVEGTFIHHPQRDPHKAQLASRRARIAGNFTDAFDRIRRTCPSGATSAGVEALVDGLVERVVMDTTVSPNVNDTAFTMITPDGPVQYQGRTFTARCIHDTPYAFFVKRGSVNKVVYYYEGGGACWDQLTCSIPTCDATVDPVADNPQNAHSGFADLSDPRNPFRDWNVVFVPYCSCDVHFGDAAQDYPLHIEHRGYENSRVVEKWAREHFVAPDEVFVTGSSAGAYGAWFNAPLHEFMWPSAQFEVLADAGNGVITPEFLQNEFQHWNFQANIPNTIPGVLESITTGTGIVGYTEAVTSFFPDTRWAHYATAYDGGAGGQTGFYNIMLHDNNPLAALTWWEGSCAFNAKMVQQATDIAAAVPSNYRYYIGTGSRHTMWGASKVYTDTTGGVPTLVDWVGQMLTGGPGWTNVSCTNCGLLLPGDPQPPTLPTPPFFPAGGGQVVIDCNRPASPSGAFVE